MAILADLLIALGLVGLALGTVAARGSYAPIALFVAYGLLLAFAWVRLGAVDVAMTEAAIGAGLSGVLLLTAASRLPPTPAVGPGKAMRGVIALGCLAVTGALAVAVLALPDPAPGLAEAVRADLPATGLGNPVGGVLMSFRALDTLLEAAVLVLAVVCVWSLAPPQGWGGVPGPRYPVAANGTFSLLARLLPPVGIVIAAHILWIGKDAPGGKFQAAAILAAMWLLAWLAGLARPPRVASPALRVAVAAGPLLFLATGLLGAAMEGAFLAYPPALTEALVIAVEVVLTGSIAVALALLVMGPPEQERDG